MSIDKAVDSQQLDGALTSTADAIRAKTGKSGEIAFDKDKGFSAAVEAIETGGGGAWTNDDIAALISRTVRTFLLPANLTKVGSSAFSNCSNLMEIDVPDAVTVIEASAFSACANLRRVKFPAKLTRIGTSAFVSCGNLESIEFPDGLETIENYAFNNCQQIKTANIPAGVKKLGASIFISNQITALTFPPTVDIANLTIDAAAFSGCFNSRYGTKLTDIYVPWAEGAIAGAPWGAIYATVHYNHTEEGA